PRAPTLFPYTTLFRSTRGESSLARARENSLAAYKGGVVSLIEVLNADGNLLQMRDEKAQAQTEVTRAAILSFRALGGGWDARNRSEEHTSELQSLAYL